MRKFTAFFISCFWFLAVSAQPDADLPELYFGTYKDRALLELSFRQEVPDYVRLTEKNGDSCADFSIVNGMIELLETGEREQIKTDGYLSDEAKFMIANARPGILKISVFCKSNDGTASFEKTMLMALGITPVIVMADTIFNGDTAVAQSRIEQITEVKIGYPAYAGMEDFFKISGGTITLNDSETDRGKILPKGALDAKSLELLKSAVNKKLTMYVVWLDSSGVGRMYIYSCHVVPD